MPPVFLNIAIALQKRKFCSRLVTTDQGGQNNRNVKMTTVIFSQRFVLVKIQCEQK